MTSFLLNTDMNSYIASEAQQYHCSGLCYIVHWTILVRKTVQKFTSVTFQMQIFVLTFV